MRVVAIVEGEGEVAAVPILLRRLSEWRSPGGFPELPTPIRVRRDRFLNRQLDFERYLNLAAAKCGDDGWILLLFDADDDCPALRASEILRRAKTCLPHRSISVVLANREYEAWFIASAESLNGRRGFVLTSPLRQDAETPRNAKGWLAERMVGGTYGETTDQPAFTASMDLEQAYVRSRSFRKICREWDRQVTAIRDR